MWSSRSISRGIVTALAATLWLAAAGAAQDPSLCEGVLADSERAAVILPQVPKYQTTYVLVFPDRLAERLTAPSALGGEGLRVGMYGGSEGAAVGGIMSVPGAVEYDFARDGAGKAVEELLAGNLEAAVLWAPLAGLGILELDVGYDLSMRTLGRPAGAPSFVNAVDAEGEPLPCANEVLVLLESYGVVPAEKLVPLHIEDLVLLRPPVRSRESALRGREVFQAYCAKCHGQEAVAAPDALAPVDLLRSVRRFSFPGFLYIALNGRERNGMPGFRGALSREQVALVYQYVRERSYGDLEAGVIGGHARN